MVLLSRRCSIFHATPTFLVYTFSPCASSIASSKHRASSGCRALAMTGGWIWGCFVWLTGVPLVWVVVRLPSSHLRPTIHALYATNEGYCVSQGVVQGKSGSNRCLSDIRKIGADTVKSNRDLSKTYVLSLTIPFSLLRQTHVKSNYPYLNALS